MAKAYSRKAHNGQVTMILPFLCSGMQPPLLAQSSFLCQKSLAAPLPSLSRLHAADTVAFDVLTQLVCADLQQQQKQTIASKQSKQVATKTKQSATPAACKRPALPIASGRTKQRVLGTAATAKKTAARSGGKTSAAHSQSSPHQRLPGKLKDGSKVRGSKVKGCKGMGQQGTSLASKACKAPATIFVGGRYRKLQPTTVGIKVPGKRPVQR